MFLTAVTHRNDRHACSGVVAFGCGVEVLL